jgi:4-O-beta-D-mannosyl-D-glucose phosphorylase
MFEERLARLMSGHEALLSRPNEIETSWSNGIFERYRYPVVTAAHVPLDWRYDLDPAGNPFLLERLAVAVAIGYWPF